MVGAGLIVWANGRAVRVPDNAARVGEGPRVLVRLSGPIMPADSAAIERAGGRIEFWCPPFGACVTLGDRESARRLAELPRVAGFVPLHPAAPSSCARRSAARAGQPLA